jgi:hypothetical protein
MLVTSRQWLLHAVSPHNIVATFMFPGVKPLFIFIVFKMYLIIILTVLNPIYPVLHTLHTLHPTRSSLPAVCVNFTTVKLSSIFEHNIDVLNFQPNQAKKIGFTDFPLVGYIYQDCLD